MSLPLYYNNNLTYHVDMDASTYLTVMSILKKREEAKIRAREKYRSSHAHAEHRSISESKTFIKLINITAETTKIIPSATVNEITNILADLKPQ